MSLPRYIMLEKAIGETPLACMETWREAVGVDASVPLTYAGRLDPMASGKMLVLIGDECKKKEEYLALDKTYEFSVLFGIGSDTHDVLGRLTTAQQSTEPENLAEQLTSICSDLTGDIELPYPHFSSKTIEGKPLHTWTLEGRLDEIEIPTRHSTIHSLTFDRLETLSRQAVCEQALTNINTIPEVTDERKALGNDFRRIDVRADWERIFRNEVSENPLPAQYTIAHFTCHCSSGTYMRMLAKLIGDRLAPPTPSLAWSIHRSEIKNIT